MISARTKLQPLGNIGEFDARRDVELAVDTMKVELDGTGGYSEPRGYFPAA
jgi:hypothetical protein